VQKGLTFYQDSCYTCNGKLVNLKGTIACMNCKSGYALNAQNQCVQTLQQRAVGISKVDELLRKISPNNPLFGLVIIVGVGLVGFNLFKNKDIIRKKLKR
jgi:hypothetical protein